jgi:hypothetical protein
VKIDALTAPPPKETGRRKRSDKPLRLCYQVVADGRGVMTVIVPLLILAAILLGVPLWVVSVYNRLVSTRNLVDNAWAQTDTQLKRRAI